jgi:DNA helicase-2/ATP-dependent DNA helicase PcrA
VTEKIVFDDIPHHEDYSQIPQGRGDAPLRAGDLVQHGMFGLGKIERITGSGDTSQATVNFSSVGRKKLMLKYAKLKRVYNA